MHVIARPHPDVLRWAYDQAVNGERHPTGTDLWYAACQAWPNLPPSGSNSLARQWELTTALIDVYRSGLSAIAVLDTVRSLRAGSGWHHATVTRTNRDSALIQVRVDAAPAVGWRIGTTLDLDRIAVEPVAPPDPPHPLAATGRNRHAAHDAATQPTSSRIPDCRSHDAEQPPNPRLDSPTATDERC